MTSALVLPLQSTSDPPQTGGEPTGPEWTVLHWLCAAKDPERGCITAMDPVFCFSNQEAFRVSFLSVLLKAAVTFASPLASFPGFFFAPAGHRAWPEVREQLVMPCQSGLSFPWKRKQPLCMSLPQSCTSVE